MNRAIVLGAGRVGRAIAFDLAALEGWQVTVADRSSTALHRVRARPPVQGITADLSDSEELQASIRDQDLVVGALPSFLGYQALRSVIRTGKPYVDISFFEEDPFPLQAMAEDHGAVAVVDCGIAPGLDNLLLGHLLDRLDEVRSFVCLVGGLPESRTLPWEYKAPFAPYDVLAEYTRPARIVESGRKVTVPALSDRKLYDFDEVGTLEGFLTDGLRTLLRTVDVSHMEERTLRYPGHAEKIVLLRDSGLLDPDPVEIDGVEISPLAVTSTQLLPHWELDPEETDLTLLRVVVTGREGEEWQRHTYELSDRRDPETGLSSMARTTGFTCTAIAGLVAEGILEEPGLYAPEHLGPLPGALESVLAHLADRGIELRHEIETINPPVA